MSDIVEHLRECAKYADEYPSDVDAFNAAADTIEALRAENARLREALKPFADEAWKFDPAWKDRPDPTGAYYPHWEKDDPPGFTIGDLRAARKAIGETDEIS